MFYPIRKGLNMKILKRIRNEILSAQYFAMLAGIIWGLILCIKIILMFIACMHSNNDTKIVISVLLYTLTIIGVFFTAEKKKSICIVSLISFLFDTMLVFCILPY